MTRSNRLSVPLFLVFLFVVLAGHSAWAQIEDQLVAPGFISITSDIGDSPINTYEDVGPIKNIHIVTPAPTSLFVAWSELMNILAHHFDHGKLGTLQTMLNVPKVILGGPSGADDVERFYRKYAFLARGPCPGGCDNEGHDHSGSKWHYNTVVTWSGGSALDEPPHDKPDSIEYLAGLEGGWRYVDPVTSWPAPHFTCDCGKRPCPDSVCEEHEVPDPTIEDPNHTKSVRQHKRAAENICYDNDPVKSSLETHKAGKKKEPQETATFKINWRDRTPPRITGPSGNAIGHFPDLGRKPGTGSTARRATTGDFFKPSDLIAVDNDEGMLTSRFAIGRMNGPTDAASAWTQTEEWGWIGDAMPSLSGSPLGKHVFLPNDCLGEMKYSVFVWDKNKVLNPGCPSIVEDSPETCYGIGQNGLGHDLGRDPKTAEPFPYTYDEANPIDLSRRFSDGDGKIWIEDNDLPNLLIRLVSKRDEGKPNSVLIFPPPIQTMLTFDPEYNAFIQNSIKTFEEINAAPNDSGTYIKPIELDLGNCPPAEQGWKWKFHLEPPPAGFSGPFPDKFWYQNFRLEDYSQSDNDLNADPIDGDEATFAKRNGFGQSAVVLCTIPVIEDVQYDLSLWAEDNVKWLNDEDNLLNLPVLQIPAPYTGIARARLSYSVENVYPPQAASVELPNNAFSSKPLPVIFREPTPPLGGGVNLATLQSGKFPWVEATVRDYAGQTRSLKVFFTVSDEKARIRVLEQKHIRN